MLQGLDLPSRYLPSQATSRRGKRRCRMGRRCRRRSRPPGRGCPSGPPPSRPSLRRSRRAAACRRSPPAPWPPDAPTIAARLAPLLSRRDGSVQGAALAKGVTDPEALAEAIRRLGDDRILFVDVKAETEGVFATYARATLAWALAGGVLVLGLLALGLRSPARALRVAGPIGGALLVTLAVLTAAGEALTLFHLASLLLLGGLAIDYSLARAAPPIRAAADDTQGAVLNCAVSTLLTFGLLAFCGTPVLHGIGLTVSVGVASAFLLACALAPRPAPHG